MNPEGEMVPGPEECFLLLKRFNVPDHVIEHSRVVYRLASVLCQTLNRHGARLDQRIVEAASILHDIAKVEVLGTGESHSQAGARLLSSLGYPEIAEIVRQHVILDPETDRGMITEAEVVHYADKRVMHATVVSLAERFRDLKERYGKNTEDLAWLEKLERQSLSLERKIFQKIPLSPESLPRVGPIFPPGKNPI